jgi:hypothetical protein
MARARRYDAEIAELPGYFPVFCVGRSEKGETHGDQAYLTWKCEGDTVVCSGPFEYTGGTGKYEKISGGNTFSAMTAVQWKDGTVSGSATWNR